jgi:hypothetical protein
VSLRVSKAQACKPVQLETKSKVSLKRPAILYCPRDLIIALCISNKGKVAPVHTMKSYKGSRSIAICFFNFAARWGWVVNAMPQPLYRWRKGQSTQSKEGCMVSRASLEGSRKSHPHQDSMPWMSNPLVVTILTTESRLISILTLSSNKVSKQQVMQLLSMYSHLTTW